MQRSFQRFDQLLDILVSRPQSCAHRDRLHDEALPLLGSSRGSETEAQELVDSAFEGIAGAFGLVLNQAGDVIIEGERGAHIMMLRLKTS